MQTLTTQAIVREHKWEQLLTNSEQENQKPDRFGDFYFCPDNNAHCVACANASR